MRTLWIFGDSFSVDFENNPIENYRNYKKFKGYFPKTWGKLLSEHLGYEYKNYAVGGWDNYSIFESICERIHLITPDDMVFIGWSPEERIRLIGGDNKWHSFNSHFPSNDWFGMDGSTIYQMIMNRVDETGYRAHKCVIKEITSWENMIRHSLKDVPHHIWRWYGSEVMSKRYETIVSETNGLVQDTHWSEKGHMDYYVDLVKQLNLNF